MDRMGKLTLSVLAVAALLTSVAVVGTNIDADGEGTEGSEPTDISSQLDWPKISMSDANTSHDVEKYLKDIWFTAIEWDTIIVNESKLDAGYGANVSFSIEGFKAAIAGTAADKDGTSGSYTLKLTDSKGKITATMNCEITTVFDYKSIDCVVAMDVANSESEVLKWLNATWISTFKDATGRIETLTVSKTKDSSFTEAVVGTSTNRSGTNGSLTFDVMTNDSTIVTGLTCTVKANSYGQLDSADKSVYFEGVLVSDLEVISKDHTLTIEELQKIVTFLNGRDATLVPSVSGIDASVRGNTLVIGDGESAKTYHNGDVLRYDGKTCVLLIGADEFSLYEIGTSFWMKFDKDTYAETYRDDEGQFGCKANNSLININGVAYYLGYILEDPSTPVISKKTYIGFIYDMSGKSAGYVTFEGNDIQSASNMSFVFNEGKDPASIENGKPVVGTYKDSDGKDRLIYLLASKDVSMVRDGKAYSPSEGKICIPAEISNSDNTSVISIGGENIINGVIDEKIASCTIGSASPFVVMENSSWSVSIDSKDLKFPSEPSESGKSNTMTYVAIVVVVILILGGAFYYFRYMKP